MSVAPAAAFRWERRMGVELVLAGVLIAMFAVYALSAWWWWP